MNRLGRYYPLAFVTVTGGVVMGLEILGTRVIGTVYGSSLFVWGALLTTTLVCLAVGYAVGGAVADRWPHDWLLYVLTILAGGLVLAIPATQGILQPSFHRFGARGGALISAFAIFAGPLTTLGLASPFVVRLLARSLRATGRTAGAVFALSTAGSVAGTLLTSFYLIPELGTRWSLAAQAAAMILVGGIGLAVRFGLRFLPMVALAAAAWPVGRGGPATTAEVLFRTESPYGRMAIVQPAGSGYRMLFVNGIMQTGMPLDIAHRDRTSLLRTDNYYLELLPYFHQDPDEPRSCLLIGLAGGCFARVMDLYPVHVTAVEIDVKVAELAKAYFGYRGAIHYGDGREHVIDVNRFPNRRIADGHDPGPEPLVQDRPADSRSDGAYRGRVVIEDGRLFLCSCRQRYDFIVLDAYSSDTIPFHLITREMFTAAREHLTDDGILAINYIGPPRHDVVTDSLVRTLADVFGPDRVVSYRSTDDPEAVQVIYFFAFRGHPRRPCLPASRWSPDSGDVDPLAYELVTRRLDLATDRGAVITDEHNPIDVARTKTALVWRTQTLAQFGRLRLHRF